MTPLPPPPTRKFRVALVGHSQVPRHLRLDQVEISVFRAPGASAGDFKTDPRLNSVLQSRFELVLVWLGSNEIRESSRVRQVVKSIKDIVDEIKECCKAKVGVILIEPRKTDQQWRQFVSQETYDKVARAVNRTLTQRTLKGGIFVQFTARPYRECLDRDGVHFDRSGRTYIKEKISNCITHHAIIWQSLQDMGGPMVD